MSENGDGKNAAGGLFRSRSVLGLMGMVVLVGMGEHMAERFLPLYLQELAPEATAVLAIGLLAGMVFGLAQQLRGAHFLSHDVASLAVCWGVACAVEVCFGRSGSVPTESRA